jgi:hypothetical protein
MSLTVAVVVNAVLAVGLFVLLATVMRIPFRLDRASTPVAAKPPDMVADERLAA